MLKTLASVWIAGSVLSATSLATAQGSAVNTGAKALVCQQQVDALMERVDAGVKPALTRQQRDQLVALAQRSCREDSAMANAQPPEGFSDWFSYFMVTHKGDKPGNKRLKKFK